LCWQPIWDWTFKTLAHSKTSQTTLPDPSALTDFRHVCYREENSASGVTLNWLSFRSSFQTTFATSMSPSSFFCCFEFQQARHRAASRESSFVITRKWEAPFAVRGVLPSFGIGPPLRERRMTFRIFPQIPDEFPWATPKRNFDVSINSFHNECGYADYCLMFE